MYIESLELNNFRNYDQFYIEFSDKTNLIYGDNAQGKTNILESLYLAATTKSHRGSKDRDMIRFNSKESHIRMFYKKDDIGHQIDMHLKKDKAKGVAIDQIPIRKSRDLIGQIPMIFFSPEDLKIIKNGPSERRKFLDLELSQLESLYLYNLTKYNKILMQRNNLLKQVYFNPSLEDTLDAWDLQLVKYGCEVIRYRKEFVEHLSNIIKSIHKKLSGGQEEIILEYEYKVDESNFYDQLKKKRKVDLKYQTTTLGPQRDDISFIVNGVDIRKFGSQGQQRTTALSLKLAQIQLIKEIKKESPVLLLDDVLSELDSHRKIYLLESIKDIQTLITCTGMDEFINDHLPVQRMFEIKKGKIVNQ